MSVIDSLTTVQTPTPSGAASVKGEQKSGADFAAMLKEAPVQPDAAADAKAPKPAPTAGAEAVAPAPEAEAAGVAKAPKDKKAAAKAEPEKKIRKSESVDANAAVAAVADAPVREVPASDKAPDLAVVSGKTGKVAAAQAPAPAGVQPVEPSSETGASGTAKPENKGALPAQAMAAPGQAIGHQGRDVRSDSKTADGANPATVRPDAPEPDRQVAVKASDTPVAPGEATALLRLAANAPATSVALDAVAKTPGKAVSVETKETTDAGDVTIAPNAAATQANAAQKATGKAAATADAATAPASAPAAATTTAMPAKSDTRDGDQPKDRDESGRSAPQSVRAPSESAAPFGLRSDIIVNAALTGTPGVGDIGSALSQQSIAIGTSGQWIDDIAREIASVSTSNGHGSFQLASITLGQMRVELTPGTSGTDIHLTVDNAAAEAALNADRGRLVQDAQLAAVRIGEVRIDRVAHIGEPQGGNLGNGSQGQGSNGGSQTGGQSATQQNAGQGNGQSARQNAEAAFGQNGGGNGAQPKSAPVRAVSSDSARGDVSARADQMNGPQARYA
ncbi:hypothetical protein [Sphingobium subterraneum]|uniref:Meckel syndrome type 1 protein n=1 Tax=Sphingobium subterraneum TaxID=627688 RepID=A0A841IYV5_9SPHN|nr:hypothetical protein [Sphingobium subterraneum]MBB6123777.1 Meckel syndrome type 1 protein [Sphingobium subterraneum]